MVKAFFFLLCFLVSGFWAHAAQAACANPAGAEADTIYNSVYHVPQYCDGTDWIAMTDTLNNDDVTDGLVGWWKFDDGAGATAADSSGSGNNGTLTNGPVWSAGKVGGAVSFDGVDDFVAVGTGNDLDLAVFTLSAWIYPTLDGSREIMSKGWSWRELRVNNTGANMQLRGCVQAPTIGCSNSAAGTLVLNKWQHVLMTYNDGGDRKVRLYINGQEPAYALQDAAVGALQSTVGENLDIGRRPVVNDRYFGGLIDDVRVYNRALAPEEVARVYNATKANCEPPIDITSGLVGHWKLDESGNTNTAVDASGQGNNGTLTNFPADESANWVAGKVNNALDFDGADDYVTADSPALLDNMTAKSGCVWAKPRSAGGGGYGRFFGKSRWDLIIDNNTGTNALHFYHERNSGNDLALRSINNAVKYNEWHHYCFTHTGGTSAAADAKLFIDGAEVSYSLQQNPGGTGWRDDSTFNFLIGEHGNTSGFYFNGILDDVRVYNRALSADEVAVVYDLTADKYDREADVRFNDDSREMEYCNGESWISMAHVAKGEPTDGLVGHWKLDESGNISTAADNSGYGNTGTLTNFPADPTANWVAGKVNNALDFDGTDDYVTVSDAAALNVGGNNNATWVFWARKDSLTDTKREIMGKGDPYDDDLRFLIEWFADPASKAIVLSTHDSTGWHGVGKNVNSNDTNWHHFAVVWNGSTLEFFQDGVSLGSGAHSASYFPATTQNLDIGRAFVSHTTNNSAIYWDGKLDDVRVYDRALSAGEIESLYRATRSDYDSGLVGHWKMDDGVGSATAADSSGYGNDGTLAGGPVWSAGQVGGALSFNGTNQRVQVPDNDAFSVNTTNKLSVAYWVKANSFNPRGNIIGKGSFGETYEWWFTAEDPSNHFRAYLGNTAKSTYMVVIDPNQTKQMGQWYHLAMVADLTVPRLDFYIDGALVGSDTTASGTFGGNTAQPLSIGENNTEYFNGLIDDVRVYNRALAGEEIRDLYNDSKGCANPAGRRGDMMYNDDYNAMQYCDGKLWVGVR